VVADAHLAPVDAGVAEGLAWHNRYAMSDAAERFRLALGRCAGQGAEAVAVLGDLSHFGGARSLEEGVRIAAGCGLPVFVVAGNHDVLERAGALGEAVGRVGARHVRLLGPAGELVVGEGLRVAGLSVQRGRSPDGFRSAGGLPVGHWDEEEEAVVLISHYPVVSLAARAAEAGLRYAGDLVNLEEVARPLLARGAPTVVVHGHLHIRASLMAGSVLQVSCAALVEPPFEVTLLDIGREGGRLAVRRRSFPVAPSPEGVRLPVLSLAEEGWAFEAGGWVPIYREAVHEQARRNFG